MLYSDSHVNSYLNKVKECIISKYGSRKVTDNLTNFLFKAATFDQISFYLKVDVEQTNILILFML